MSDRESLLLILAAIYLVECVVFVRREGVLLRRVFSSRFRFLAGNELPGNEIGGFALAQPLPPFGTHFVAQLPPLSIGEQGALVYTALSVPPGPRAKQGGGFVAFDSMRAVSAERDVLCIDGIPAAKTVSRELGAHLAALLDELARIPRAKRGARLDREIERAFDLEAIRRDADSAIEAGRALLPLAGLQFALVFGVLPAALWIGTSRTGWIAVVAGIVGTSVAIALRARRLEARIAGGRSRQGRGAFVLLAVSPLSGIRAGDFVGRHALATRHPLAIAKVLAPESFPGLARAALRDARAPCWPELPLQDGIPVEAARAAEQSWRARVVRAIERLAPEIRDADAPPARLDEDCVAYCERCEQQYVRVDARCENCGGRPLAPWLRSPA